MNLSVGFFFTFCFCFLLTTPDELYGQRNATNHIYIAQQTKMERLVMLTHALGSQSVPFCMRECFAVCARFCFLGLLHCSFTFTHFPFTKILMFSIPFDSSLCATDTMTESFQPDGFMGQRTPHTHTKTLGEFCGFGWFFTFCLNFSLCSF